MNDYQMKLEDYDTEQMAEWEAVVEAVLFTMGNSVELGQLAIAIGQEKETARQVVERLRRRYDEERRGMQILPLEDAYQMTTRADYYENLIRVAAAPKKQVLTDVLLETLSIVAYKQPVTKVEISRIRGVSSDHAVNRLVEYGLICEVGRLDAPGRPMLFATTEEFLRRFGVTSTTDLPTMNPEEQDEIVHEVEEELQVHLDADGTLREEPEEAETDGIEPETEMMESEPEEPVSAEPEITDKSEAATEEDDRNAEENPD
ncbi:MAG: SMC-Scp complex subunit ScpB [Clostridiales bacterium]|nr:SMC-Scp complex subunit ScpB [Clostridiales bacterium]